MHELTQLLNIPHISSNGFGTVHRVEEEKTRQDIEDIINSIHEPSLDVLDHSFASYSDQPSPTTPRNSRFVGIVTS